VLFISLWMTLQPAFNGFVFGALNWSLSDDASWLTLSLTNGTNSGSSTLTVNISGMSAGTYNAFIAILAAGNITQLVPVTLTIAPSGGTSQKMVGANGTTATGNDDPNFLLIDRFTAEATGSLSHIKIKCGAAGKGLAGRGVPLRVHGRRYGSRSAGGFARVRVGRVGSLRSVAVRG
jgi:hypothetical protein